MFWHNTFEMPLTLQEKLEFKGKVCSGHLNFASNKQRLFKPTGINRIAERE